MARLTAWPAFALDDFYAPSPSANANKKGKPRSSHLPEISFQRFDSSAQRLAALIFYDLNAHETLVSEGAYREDSVEIYAR